MAGWPVTLIGRVNALPRPDTYDRRYSPSGDAGPAVVGVTSTSYSSHHCSAPALIRCIVWITASSSGAEIRVPSQTIDHDRGSRSSSPSGWPIRSVHAAASAAALAPIASRAASHNSSLESSAGALTST